MVSTNTVAEWLDGYVWPDIHSMMLNDAYFKLMEKAHAITGRFNGPIGRLIVNGYVTFQTIAIRRLTDPAADVISLRRALTEARATSPSTGVSIDGLLNKLNCCDRVRHMTNKHVAHTDECCAASRVTSWSLRVDDLTEAQRAICEVAIVLERDILGTRNRVGIIAMEPMMQEFECWVPPDAIEELKGAWRVHNDRINRWVNVRHDESQPIL